ncbi:MAG TPA: Holliday junction resolvase RuvX [Tepidiformaceae bacterium]
MAQQAPPDRHSPPRLLAIDPGSRRTGVAVSDDLGLFAHARPALVVAGEARLVEAVRELVEAEQADEVIVGLPLSMSGLDSAQTARVRDLVMRLRKVLPVPVTPWDERLSSVQARRDVRDRDRSGTLDSAAAALVLQSVLDARRTGARAE